MFRGTCTVGFADSTRRDVFHRMLDVIERLLVAAF